MVGNCNIQTLCCCYSHPSPFPFTPTNTVLELNTFLFLLLKLWAQMLKSQTSQFSHMEKLLQLLHSGLAKRNSLKLEFKSSAGFPSQGRQQSWNCATFSPTSFCYCELGREQQAAAEAFSQPGSQPVLCTLLTNYELHITTIKSRNKSFPKESQSILCHGNFTDFLK